MHTTLTILAAQGAPVPTPRTGAVLLPIDWFSLALGIVFLVTGLALAVKFRRDDRDANIHYIYTLTFALGVGFMCAFIPGTLGVDGSLEGLSLRAGGGLAGFALAVIVFYLLQTRKGLARVHAARAYRVHRDIGVKSGCGTSDPNCDNIPITICTSLPGASGTSQFQTDCRQMTEIMCRALVRSMEEYCRTKAAEGVTALPMKLQNWKAWAITPVTGSRPGLPGCLDLSTPSRTLGESMRVDIASMPLTSTPDQLAAARYTNRVYGAVETLGGTMMTFDVDTWHDW